MKKFKHVAVDIVNIIIHRVFYLLHRVKEGVYVCMYVCVCMCVCTFVSKQF